MKNSNRRFVTLVGALYVCSAMALNSGLVLAACADVKVRPNSPCKTEIKVCGFPPCSELNEVVYAGNFQCDQPNEGTQCTGTGQFANCRNECHCAAQLGQCVVVPPCQLYQAETKKTVDCAT